MPLARAVVTHWPTIVAICIALAACAVFVKDVLTIVKLREEVAALRAERVAAPRLIAEVTFEQVEQYGGVGELKKIIVSGRPGMVQGLVEAEVRQKSQRRFTYARPSVLAFALILSSPFLPRLLRFMHVEFGRTLYVAIGVIVLGYAAHIAARARLSTLLSDHGKQ